MSWKGDFAYPFAVQWTGRLPTEVVYSDHVSSLDIVATSAAVARGFTAHDRVYDGLNILPYLGGNRSARCGRYSGVVRFRPRWAAGIK